MYTKNILLWKYLVENKYEKKKLKKWLPNKGLIEKNIFTKVSRYTFKNKIFVKKI